MVLNDCPGVVYPPTGTLQYAMLNRDIVDDNLLIITANCMSVLTVYHRDDRLPNMSTRVICWHGDGFLQFYSVQVDGVVH